MLPTLGMPPAGFAADVRFEVRVDATQAAVLKSKYLQRGRFYVAP
jgi:hypothetical protein